MACVPGGVLRRSRLQLQGWFGRARDLRYLPSDDQQGPSQSAISFPARTPKPLTRSGDGKTRRVGLSGAIASLVVAVPRVTRRVTGRPVRALGMDRPRVRGGAGLAPAAGLIRSLSAV